MANALLNQRAIFTKVSSLGFAAVVATIALAACAASGSGDGKANFEAQHPVPVFSLAINPAATAPNGLPAILDSTAPSVDRQTMESVMVKAQQDNKSVVLEVAAAWCGPCTQFAYDLDSHPQYLTTLANNGYIFVKAESERSPTGLALNTADFLPSIISFFPSFYLYTPNQGWRTLGVLASYQDLANILHDVGTKPVMSLSDMKTFIETNGANPQGNLSTGPAAELFGASTMGLAANYSYADGKAILALLRSENTKFPNLQLGDTADQIEGIFVEQYYGIGAVDLAGLNQDFPADAASFTDLSNQGFNVQWLEFELSTQIRTAGLKATAAKCPAIWQGARAKLTQGTLATADFQAALAKLDNQAVLMCAALDLRANGVSPTLQHTVAAVDQSTITDWSLIAGLSNAQAAVAKYHARFTAYLDYYNQNLQDLNTQLAAATTAGDQAKIVDLTQQINVQKFQITNHTKVDTEVEAALTAGQPVHVLKVLN